MKDKELNCLYGLSGLVEMSNISLEEILKRMVNIIPSSWQYPEITCARIVVNKKEFKTVNFKNTGWRQSAGIVVKEENVGVVDVFYLEKRPEINEGPFLNEERDLIDAVAERLGKIIECRKAEEEIQSLAKFPSEDPNPVFRVSERGDLLYANTAGHDLISSKNCFLENKCDSELWQDTITEALTSKSEKGFKLECNSRIYSFVVIPVPEQDYANLYGRDITERKRIEDDFQTEKNKLQSIIEAMEYGMTIQNFDYDIIYQNELLNKTFGHLGEKCYRVYEGKERVCDGCPVKKAFKDGKSHTAVREVVMPSGEIAFWENTANPIRGARGEIISCLEIARDITERKKVEDALKASEEKVKLEKRALREKNIVLKEILRQIEEEKKEIKHQVVTNVDKILMPILRKLKKRSGSIERGYLDLLEKNLENIVSPFIDRLSGKYSKLTPREIQVCNLIKEGLSSKEIAALLNLSVLTVHRYREHIRKKLEIANKKINLISYLHSL